MTRASFAHWGQQQENPCRTFAEVSYALSRTIMVATDVTAKKQHEFNNLG